jgi:hypothetical protein
MYSFSQDTTIKKILAMKNGKVRYETAFVLELPEDTILKRAENWVTEQKGYQNDLFYIKISDWRTSIDQKYLKCRIAFSQLLETNNKNKSSLPQDLKYLYTLRVYTSNRHKVEIIIDELSLTGNLTAIGISADKSKKDTIFVEDFQKLQTPSPSAVKNREIVFNNYKKADAYLKNSIREIIGAVYNKPIKINNP